MTAGDYRAHAGISPATSGAPTEGGPVIHSIDPTIGPSVGGTTVVITGSGFKRVRWCYLRSSGEPLRFMQFTADSDAQITAITPPGTPERTYRVAVQASF